MGFVFSRRDAAGFHGLPVMQLLLPLLLVDLELLESLLAPRFRRWLLRAALLLKHAQLQCVLLLLALQLILLERARGRIIRPPRCCSQ